MCIVENVDVVSTAGFRSDPVSATPITTHYLPHTPPPASRLPADLVDPLTIDAVAECEDGSPAASGSNGQHGLRGSALPVAMQAAVLAVVALGLLGGVRSIQRLAPLLLAISLALLLFSFCYG